MDKKLKIYIINGPNLNLLGVREKNIYGSFSFEDYFEKLKISFRSIELIYFQSNHEGELIDKIHEVGFNADGIVLNAGAYTHTSIALADAIKAITCAVVEVHISNVHAREEYRHKSFISKNCVGGIFGMGMEGYKLAIDFLLSQKSADFL